MEAHNSQRRPECGPGGLITKIGLHKRTATVLCPSWWMTWGLHDACLWTGGVGRLGQEEALPFHTVNAGFAEAVIPG